MTVGAVSSYLGAKWMHDLTVERTHTFYVLAAAVPVLVHNKGCPTEYSNTYDSDGSNGILATVDSDGILNTVITAGDGTPSGGQMFKDAIDAVGRTSGASAGAGMREVEH